MKYKMKSCDLHIYENIAIEAEQMYSNSRLYKNINYYDDNINEIC